MSSYEEVTAILAQCRISHFRQAFLDNECDDSFLDIVEDGDLRELGLPLGPRVRLLKAVADRNAARARAPAVPPTRPSRLRPPPQGSAQAAVPPPRPRPGSPRRGHPREHAPTAGELAIAGCEHKFCRVASTTASRAKPNRTPCPNCRAPFTGWRTSGRAVPPPPRRRGRPGAPRRRRRPAASSPRAPAARGPEAEAAARETRRRRSQKA